MSDTVFFAFIVGAFVGSAAGYLGSIMISKHMALVGDALSHVALPGLVMGILFIGAFALLAPTAEEKLGFLFFLRGKEQEGKSIAR